MKVSFIENKHARERQCWELTGFQSQLHRAHARVMKAPELARIVIAEGTGMKKTTMLGNTVTFTLVIHALADCFRTFSDLLKTLLQNRAEVEQRLEKL